MISLSRFRSRGMPLQFLCEVRIMLELDDTELREDLVVCVGR